MSTASISPTHEWTGPPNVKLDTSTLETLPVTPETVKVTFLGVVPVALQPTTWLGIRPSEPGSAANVADGANSWILRHSQRQCRSSSRNAIVIKIIITPKGHSNFIGIINVFVLLPAISLIRSPPVRRMATENSGFVRQVPDHQLSLIRYFFIAIPRRKCRRQIGNPEQVSAVFGLVTTLHVLVDKRNGESFIRFWRQPSQDFLTVRLPALQDFTLFRAFPV